jgi:hypothetical protein
MTVSNESLLRKVCKRLNLVHDHKDVANAQCSSIRRHYRATGINAAGLAGGIVLIFSSASFGERFSSLVLKTGIWLVVVSIILYLVTEWMACDDDAQVAELANQQNEKQHQEMLAAAALRNGRYSGRNRELDRAVVQFIYRKNLDGLQAPDSENTSREFMDSQKIWE